jgi:hypothetical protein
MPGYGVSLVLKKMGLLRISEANEILGLDLSDYGIEGYPEYSIVPEQTGLGNSATTPMTKVSSES